MKWLPVVGYEGIYEVSEYGDVRLLVRRKGRKMPPDGMMKIQVRGGYKVVTLTDDKKNSKMRKIHKLIADAFLGECPEGMEVDHIDGNKLNSQLNNLEYVTHQENVQRARNLGLQRQIKGSEQWLAKLTEHQITEIREKHRRGIKQSVLAVEYGVTQAAIYLIIKRINWKHVE